VPLGLEALYPRFRLVHVAVELLEVNGEARFYGTVLSLRQTSPARARFNSSIGLTPVPAPFDALPSNA
jgi:hypothetical protein